MLYDRPQVKYVLDFCGAFVEHSFVLAREFETASNYVIQLVCLGVVDEIKFSLILLLLLTGLLCCLFHCFEELFSYIHTKKFARNGPNQES